MTKVLIDREVLIDMWEVVVNSDEPAATIERLGQGYRAALSAKPVEPDRFFPFEFEVWQDDFIVASASGTREDALREAMNYAIQYEQDGPVRVFEVTRTLVAPPEHAPQVPLAEAGGESTPESPAVACPTETYPTVWAYEQACKALNAAKERIAELEQDYSICKHSLEAIKNDMILKNAQLTAEKESADRRVAAVSEDRDYWREECQAAEKDAERYRFLRQPNVGKWNVSQWMNEPAMFVRQDWTDLDYAVDFAIAQGKENGNG